MHSRRMAVTAVISTSKEYCPFRKAPTLAVVIVCRPHRLSDGGLDNDVIRTLSNTLVQVSLASFGFDLRRVDGSQDYFDKAIGVEEAVEAAPNQGFSSRVAEIILYQQTSS